MNTVDLSSLTRLPMKKPHSKHTHRTCAKCKVKKITRESYTHDMEFENDYLYCDECYPKILEKRLNKYQTTARHIEEILKMEEGAMANRRRKVRTDDALGSEVGASHYYLVNGCFVNNGVHDFCFLIHGFNLLRKQSLVQVLSGMELLDFNVCSMGYQEYNEVKDNLPVLTFRNSLEGYEYGIGQMVLKIKRNVKY
jgi:hypothetical protein